MTDNPIKFPATHIAHWVSGPVYCCESHANTIAGIAQIVGAHVAVTLADDGHECVNCVSESENDNQN